MRSVKRKKALGIVARKACCYSCKRKFGDINYIHKPDCHTPDEHISVGTKDAWETVVPSGEGK